MTHLSDYSFISDYQFSENAGFIWCIVRLMNGDVEKFNGHTRESAYLRAQTFFDWNKAKFQDKNLKHIGGGYFQEI